MRVVLGPQARRTFRRAAKLERHGIGLNHNGAGFCEKRKHVTIAGLRVLFVERFTDEEQWPGPQSRLPTSPRAVSFTEAWCNAECGHQRVVENQCSVEVADADRCMGEHG